MHAESTPHDTKRIVTSYSFKNLTILWSQLRNSPKLCHFDTCLCMARYCLVRNEWKVWIRVFYMNFFPILICNLMGRSYLLKISLGYCYCCYCYYLLRILIWVWLLMTTWTYPCDFFYWLTWIVHSLLEYIWLLSLANSLWISQWSSLWSCLAFEISQHMLMCCHK